MNFLNINLFQFLNILLCIAVVSLTNCSRSTNFDEDNKKVNKIIVAMSDSINAKQFFPDKDVRNYLHNEFSQFYEERNYELAWLSFKKPLPQAEELLEALDEADLEGLIPENYNLSEIERLLQDNYQIDSKKKSRRSKLKTRLNKKAAAEAMERDTLKFMRLVKLDFLMTSSYLTYASHLLSGKINPNEEKLWFTKPRKRDLSQHLEQALTDDKIKASFEDLTPKHPQYELLKNALKKYSSNVNTEWPSLDFAEMPKPGESTAAVFALKQRLFKLSYLSENEFNTDSTTFDASMEKAIAEFQETIGLESLGSKIDKATIAQLNIQPKERLEQIKVNMERVKYLPENFGDRYILVNIPAFSLSLMEGKKTTMEMKVVVGKEYNPTPVFSDTMTYIVFNPTWTVPKNIAVKEMLPALQKNPEFLGENFSFYDSWSKDAQPIDPKEVKWEDYNEENFNFRIVEIQGEKNSLGLVKFMFPNSEDIYLHDTPADYLFERDKRAFSHGCIRLEKPIDLAKFLLQDNPEWNSTKIQETLQQPESVSIPLKKKVPVHLVYWTAWVNEAGQLNFREDIYKHDDTQEKEIKQKERLLGKL